MALRKYARFQVNFSSKWTETSGALMGLAFFLRIVYYFGMMNLRDVGIIELLTSAFAGIAMSAYFVVMLSCLHRNAPGLYGIIGALHCLLLVILSITGGNIVRMILAVVWYSAAVWVLLNTVKGMLPGRLLAALMFFIPIFVRLFFFDLGHLGLIRWVQEFAVLSTLASMGCFSMGLTPLPQKQ